MTKHVPRVLVVGGVGMDFSTSVNFNLNADDRLGRKVNGLEAEFRLGGAAANASVAVKLLDKAFQTYTRVDLNTRIGKPPVNDRVARVAHQLIIEDLEAHKIRYKDITHGGSHSPLNFVVKFAAGDGYDGDRFIIRDPAATTGDLEPGYKEVIAHDVSGCNVVFVDPKKRRMGLTAVQAAKKQGKISVVDWGEDKWPEDHEEAAMCDAMIRHAGVVVVPDDAIVAGMSGRDANALFDKLQHHYGQKNIVMSNGGKAVRIMIDGCEDEIPIYSFGETIDTNASGDTRDAGMVWALSRGYGLRDAVEFGTALASVKICYSGLDWANHVATDLQQHPRVSGFVRQIISPSQGEALNFLKS